MKFIPLTQDEQLKAEIKKANSRKRYKQHASKVHKNINSK